MNMREISQITDWAINSFHKTSTKAHAASDLGIDIDTDLYLYPDNQIERFENSEVFNEILSLIETQLPEKMVRILKLRFFEEVSIKEIAEIENMATSSIYRIVNRALSAIRSMDEIQGMEEFSQIDLK